MGFHEIIPAGENARFEGYAQEIKALQARNNRGTTGAMKRALHVKQHVGAVGALALNGAGQGLFAKAASYPVYVRFSNGSSAHASDKGPDARGFAVKLVGVPGQKIIPGLEDKQTQDLLFIATPALPFKDADEFVSFVRCAKDGPGKMLPRIFRAFGVLGGFKMLRKLASQPSVTSFAAQPFHTGAPIAWGETAAKLSLVPLSVGSARVKLGTDHLSADLVGRLGAAPMTWTVRAQPFVDDDKTPIEDASVVWQGPCIDVGTLTLPQQDEAKLAKTGAVVETLSFDPWHALVEHRPLGSIMRARASAYRESVMARKAADEPTSIAQ